MSSHKDNFILKSDSYKLSHARQYPKGTDQIYSYLEARKGAAFPYTIFFGLHYYLQALQGQVLTLEKIEQADAFAKAHFGSEIFDKAKWLRLLEKHDGRLPLKIKAVQEGVKVPISNVLMTIQNTDPEFPWLTNFVETHLMKVWYPITIATHSYAAKSVINRFLAETSDTPEHANFALHDFAYRGVASEEQAGIGAAAHLTSFMGTDTLAGIIFANDYYPNADKSFQMHGFSVPASEHSTATPWGKDDGELDYINNMLDLYPTGIVSMVADSYDVYEFAKKLGTFFKDRIMNRDGRVVVRPDSGDPVEVNAKLIQILAEYFGTTTNSKGYKVLPNQIRIIQGDGIHLDMIVKILAMLEEAGFSAENIVFGSGGGLLQKFDRDTMRFAIKCSKSIRNGVEINVQKDPATAKGKDTKTSKKGELKLIKNFFGEYETLSSADTDPETFAKAEDQLDLVFINGDIVRYQSFDFVRKTVEENRQK